MAASEKTRQRNLRIGGVARLSPPGRVEPFMVRLQLVGQRLRRGLPRSPKADSRTGRGIGTGLTAHAAIVPLVARMIM